MWINYDFHVRYQKTINNNKVLKYETPQKEPYKTTQTRPNINYHYIWGQK